MSNQMIQVRRLKCERCGYKWVPRKKLSEVRYCPKCHSAWWNTKRMGRRKA